VKVIDLSTAFIEGRDVISALQPDPPVYCGHECYAYDLHIKSHSGTYFETSAHVFRKGMCTNDIRAEELVLPGYCIHINSNEQCITAAHLHDVAGMIAPGSAVLVDVGNDRTKYFSRDAAQWMAANKVKLMGSNANRYDCGFVNPTGFFVDLFKAEIPIVARLENLDLLPAAGFDVIALPLKIENVCTAPCRVIAVIH
jgi:kynurenine formamidase